MCTSSTKDQLKITLLSKKYQKTQQKCWTKMEKSQDCLTLTFLSPTKSNKGKWRKCSKSHYVIEAGIIWARNRCPGRDSRVACQGWTVYCGARVPRFVSRGGSPIFGPLPFQGDSLEMKNPLWELGLIIILPHILRMLRFPLLSWLRYHCWRSCIVPEITKTFYTQKLLLKKMQVQKVDIPRGWKTRNPQT